MPKGSQAVITAAIHPTAAGSRPAHRAVMLSSPGPISTHGTMPATALIGSAAVMNSGISISRLSSTAARSDRIIGSLRIQSIVSIPTFWGLSPHLR